MVNKYKVITYRLLKTMVRVEETQRARLRELKGYEGFSLKMDGSANGEKYYLMSWQKSKGAPREYKYLGKEPNSTVNSIKEVKYLEKSLNVLGKNIMILRKALDEVKDYNTEAIEQMLPPAYRGASIKSGTSIDKRALIWKKQSEAYKATVPPYFPEELTQPTDDGSMVRTKSEAMIYNLLLKLGVTFVYELPTKVNSKTRFPDFSLLSEVDYKTVILIEHQGVNNDSGYSEGFNTRVYDYLRAGYISGINIFYTFDSYKGKLNTEPIRDIVRLKIRPDEMSTFKN